MKIDDNFIGLISCDEIKEILDKRDEALEIAERGMYIVELSNKIADKINVKHCHWNVCKKFDDIRSLNRHHMMSSLKLYWSKKIWQILAEKSGLYIYMDKKTLEEWIAKVSLNDFPEPNIYNIKNVFEEYFSKIKFMIKDNVLDLQNCFEFILQYPNKIIIKDLICEDTFEVDDDCFSEVDDEYFRDEKKYFDHSGISKIYKLLKVCCILDDDLNALKEECDIKNDLNEIYMAGMNEWKCKYFNICVEQKVGFLYITNKLILNKIINIIQDKAGYSFLNDDYHNPDDDIMIAMLDDDGKVYNVPLSSIDIYEKN